MAGILIQRLETRYRLPQSALAEQRRLDQLRIEVVDRAFSIAFDQLGLTDESELCIRGLQVLVRLRLDLSDQTLVQHWSEALADEIRSVVNRGSGSNVVSYRSRRHALIDFAVSVPRGDLRRVWAWRQLGLWRSREVPTQALAISELVQALCAESALVIPILRALAEAGQFESIAIRLEDRQWEALAWSALSQIGRVHLIDEVRAAFADASASGNAEASFQSASRLNDVHPATPSSLDTLNSQRASAAHRDALRVVGKSHLLRAVASSVSLRNANPAVGCALAFLSVLEVEPTLTRVEVVTEVISSITNTVTFEPGETGIEAHDHLEDSATGSRSPETANLNEFTKAASREFTEAAGTSTLARTSDGAAADPHLKSEPRDERDEDARPEDLQRRALTRAGGLLFLLGVIDDLKLPEEIWSHPELSARPFLWVIHQLALALVNLPPDDPAVLAFAGLAPQALPPSDDQEPPVGAEAIEFRAYVTRIVEYLRVVLEVEDESDSALLESICRRRAEVVAAPGWIEVRFSLDEVSTEIRRAGLDLDPGYIPWLGVVVKFVYE
ncbi:MAG TPA: hypothetical protein VGO68_21335 [Pyrinomonadaceae bacterium]|nr:hypothetical protein [Pyrinomonadaceae bacterium]